MTMTSRDGGPAFPTHDADPGTDPRSQILSGGMTLRDWFAGQALNQASREIWAEHKPEDVAARCYMLADAMLAARDIGERS